VAPPSEYVFTLIPQSSLSRVFPVFWVFCLPFVILELPFQLKVNILISNNSKYLFTLLAL